MDCWSYRMFVLICVCFFGSFACKKAVDRDVEHATISEASIVPSSAIDSNQEKSSRNEGESLSATSFEWKYELSSTDYSCRMPSTLLEISALSFVDDETMIAVNDEQADLFFIDKKSCTVTRQIDFGKNGDYEGVEYVNGVAYILKSNGNVYPYNTHTDTSLETIKSALKAVNDVEGLGYDGDANMLVLACKGAPELKNYSSKKKRKAFYGLDLEKGRLLTEPLWVIEDDQLFEFYNLYLKEDDQSKKSIKRSLSRLKTFSPSAIAKHPIDGSFYILSSVGKLLVICSSQGKIEHIEFLDEGMFTQPEGIAFTSYGAMYISNEGRSFFGKIQGFEYKG